MSKIQNAYALKRVESEQVVWLTTVTRDGAPLPTPVWFIYTGDEFVVLSAAAALKVKNILANPRVSLNFDGDSRGGNIVVLSGVARVDSAGLSDDDRATYVNKYREGIKTIGHTPESMFAAYATAIRIKVDRVRADE